MGFQKSAPRSATWSLVLLVIVSLASFLPALWILSYFHPYVIRLPGYDYLSLLIYFARLPFVIVGAIVTVTVYVDLVTPAVIGAWAIALRSYAEAIYGSETEVKTPTTQKSFLDVSKDSVASPPVAA
ncbi:hypothetical protein L596_020317 [Steinernema carpocapsae]|uniref:Uncharacterized protein n=1 Tax=Steinernema carpocapsae TaxID=34508 RepID=A0A4U5MT58_STECR|nr:hypothetical protein L596_020317 [Steinernema carpocapsae]